MTAALYIIFSFIVEIVPFLSQYQQILGGKCGFCGDAYDGDRPHEFGLYNTGTIARTYAQGQVRLKLKMI